LIPAGTQVTAKRIGADDEPPTFTTLSDTLVVKGSLQTIVTACHAQFIEAELIGVGSGDDAQTMHTRHVPVMSTSDKLVPVIAVENRDDVSPGIRAIEYNGKSFALWYPVKNFSEHGQGSKVYQLDAFVKRVQFAPKLMSAANEPATLLAEFPSAGSEVRAWYWHGGGLAGNVAPETLTVIKSNLPGLRVTNPQAASGGRDAESLEHARIRGPQEIHSLERAVTARDFEHIALRTGSVDRAQAYTKATLWHHAIPGTVEILILPHIPEQERAGIPVTTDLIQKHCAGNEAVLEAIRYELSLRRPLGTECLVNWAHCKPVRVKAQVVVFSEENANAVRQRVLEKLYSEINPLPSEPNYRGWVSGQALTSWNVYRIIGSEPGVKAINAVRLAVESAPATDVSALGVDAFQQSTWYAGANNTLFRSMNNGKGWESIHTFGDETIVTVAPYDQPTGINNRGSGLLALVTKQDTRCLVRLSRDCGETWEILQPIAFHVNAVAWLDRGDRVSLLLAAERGLFELALDKAANPDPILVDDDNPDLGFHDVVVVTDHRNPSVIAVAATQGRGIFLSQLAGQSGSFKSIGMNKVELRVLAIQHSGPHDYLWAGFAAVGEAPGEGCVRLRLTDEIATQPQWQDLSAGWSGLKAGSCLGLAFTNTHAFAATSNQGVLLIDVGQESANWQAPGVDSNLPLREVGRYQRVEAIAANATESRIMVAGKEGVYLSNDLAKTYRNCSPLEYENEVSLPPNWLMCSSEHEIDVVSESE